MTITRTHDRIGVNVFGWTQGKPVSVDGNGERWIEISDGEFIDLETEARRVCRRGDGTWEAWKVDTTTTTGPRQCNGAGIHPTFEAAATATVS